MKKNSLYLKDILKEVVIHLPKKGDQTDWGKSVTSFRSMVNVFAINVVGENKNLTDFIIDLANKNYLEVFIGKKYVFVISDKKSPDQIYNIFHSFLTSNIDYSGYREVVAITDKDYVITEDDIMENSENDNFKF